MCILPHIRVQKLVHRIILTPRLPKYKSSQAPTLIWIQTGVGTFVSNISTDNTLAKLGLSKRFQLCLDQEVPSSSRKKYIFNPNRDDWRTNISAPRSADMVDHVRSEWDSNASQHLCHSSHDHHHHDKEHLLNTSSNPYTSIRHSLPLAPHRLKKIQPYHTIQQHTSRDHFHHHNEFDNYPTQPTNINKNKTSPSSLPSRCTAIIDVKNLPKLAFCLITNALSYPVRYTIVYLLTGEYTSNMENIYTKQWFQSMVFWTPLYKETSQGSEMYRCYSVFPLAKHLHKEQNNKTRWIQPGRIRSSGTLLTSKPIGG